MIQSIKVDIVYYSIGSDFEMEFNLCGCCRMRLLTDKVEGQSDFSKSLSRAVKRSRVIMLCGPLFGEKGLINTVSKVTGIVTEKIDRSAYNLSTDSDIDILKGSTALVSDDGVFGGCIIESSTQSIIILSESKSLRKNIMKQLIYPYITKLSIMPTVESEPHDDDVTDTNDKAEDQTEINQTVTEQDADSSETTETVDETVEDSKPESKDDTLKEDNPSFSDDFVIDISNADVAKSAKNAQDETPVIDSALIFDTNGDSDNLSVEEKNQKYYLFDDESDETEADNSGLSVAIKILIAFIVLLALLILYLAVAKPLITQRNVLSYLKDIFKPRVFIDFIDKF